MIAVEDASIRVFSHFVGRSMAPINYKAGGNYTAVLTNNEGSLYDGGNFTLYSATDVLQNIGSTDLHYLKWNLGAGGVGQCVANLGFNFASRTKPITYTWRFKRSDHTKALFLGLTNWPTWSTNTTPTDGIFLLLGAAADKYRFRSTSSVSALSTTGADFAAIADNTWFEVKIVFGEVPGVQAECFVDGLSKETFTTNLPTTINLYGRASWIGAGDEYIDRALTSAAGTLSDTV